MMTVFNIFIEIIPNHCPSHSYNSLAAPSSVINSHAVHNCTVRTNTQRHNS